MLKGKALIDFEEWFEKKKFIATGYYQGIGADLEIQFSAEYFFNFDHGMQQGVLREFFESKGYGLNINPFWENNYVVGYEYSLIIAREYLETCDEIFKDYNTAFTHAIDKACELYGRGE